MTEREIKEVYEDEIDLYELLLVLKKRLKLIIAVFVLGVVAAAVMSFLMPNIYQARTTMLVDSFLTQAFLNNLQQYQFKGDFGVLLQAPPFLPFLPPEARGGIRRVALYGCPQKDSPPAFRVQYSQDASPVFSV